jgi:NAD(P)-dependent dehydrogenase (short-subunit alcohol dehydrogenase family)
MTQAISLDHSVALVTGAGKGIGRATALALAEAGADVIVAARTKSDVDEVAAQIRALGRRALAVSCDVAVESQVEAMMRQGIEQFGKVDILVNNAGGAGPRRDRVAATSMDEFNKVVAVNLNGTVSCSKHALQGMLARKSGVIINVSSTAGRMPLIGMSAYVAAKWAVIGLTQCMALEVAKEGIRVNCVVPGYTLTEALDARLHAIAAEQGISYEESYAKAAALSPQNRIATSREVADVIVFLASEKAISIHGQTINANAALFMN